MMAASKMKRLACLFGLKSVYPQRSLRHRQLGKRPIVWASDSPEKKRIPHS